MGSLHDPSLPGWDEGCVDSDVFKYLTKPKRNFK